MPRPLPPTSAPPPEDAPYANWYLHLEPLMWIQRFDLQYASAYVRTPPIGIRIEGTLKPSPDATSDQGRRRYFYDAFEQILAHFDKLGARYEQHPRFNLKGYTAFEPNRLITECHVEFHLLPGER